MELWKNKAFDKHKTVAFVSDAETGLRAIIAIHALRFGKALGGVRFYDYKNEGEALTDVLRLSRAMTLKAAINNIPLGGGKAVILGNSADYEGAEREALLKAFAKHLNTLNGEYYAAEDVGTTVADLSVMFEESPYVAGLPEHIEVIKRHDARWGSGDPSPVTAQGVFYGILECLHRLYPNKKLSEHTFYVEGAGNTGYRLARFLHQAGAGHLYVADINPHAIAMCLDEFRGKVTRVSTDEGREREVTVYAPCALGNVVNDDTIPKFNCKIIAGSANNQLGELRHGDLLHERGILYAPDHIINSGGLLNVANEIESKGHYDRPDVFRKLLNIRSTLGRVFDRSAGENRSPARIAEEIALRILELECEFKETRRRVW